MEYLRNRWKGSETDRAAQKMDPTPYTPRSERPRGTYGSLIGSVQSVRDLCPQGKCFRKASHDGACYPASSRP